MNSLGYFVRTIEGITLKGEALQDLGFVGIGNGPNQDTAVLANQDNPYRSAGVLRPGVGFRVGVRGHSRDTGLKGDFTGGPPWTLKGFWTARSFRAGPGVVGGSKSQGRSRRRTGMG